MTFTAHSFTTTKTASGFAWTVVGVGYQIPTEVLKAGHCPTRAQATGRAKAWLLYFRRSAQKAA